MSKKYRPKYGVSNKCQTSVKVSNKCQQVSKNVSTQCQKVSLENMGVKKVSIDVTCKPSMVQIYIPVMYPGHRVTYMGHVYLCQCHGWPLTLVHCTHCPGLCRCAVAPCRFWSPTHPVGNESETLTITNPLPHGARTMIKRMGRLASSGCKANSCHGFRDPSGMPRTTISINFVKAHT